MRKFVLLIGIYCLCLVQVARAQGDEFLEHFSLLENEGTVLLNWTTRQGNTCNGIEILRSTDGVNYQEVGRIAGVCGSPGEAQAFSFTDLMPVINQTNFYKLNLGSLGQSSVRAIEVVAVTGLGYLLKPHPVVDQSKLYFENDSHEECLLTAFSVDGNLAFSQSTREGYFVIDAAAHFHGLYFFTIQDGSGKRLTQGKILLR